MKKKLFGCLLILGIVLLFNSCYTPSPLYGTWTDNEGDKITFVQDGSFSAKILNSEGKSQIYEGDWSCIDNVLIFNISGDVSYSRDTEWDIRGAILYLTWTANNNTKNLTLYHTSR